MHPARGGFAAKVHRVREEAEAARVSGGRHFCLTSEVAPGVRLALIEIEGVPLAFSLWESPDDVVRLCNDTGVPPTSALLAIDDDQVRAAAAAGQSIDVARLSPSQSAPGTHYALLHYAGRRQIHRLLHRLVSPMRSTTAAA